MNTPGAGAGAGAVHIITTQSCGRCKFSRALPNTVNLPPGAPESVRCRWEPDEQFSYIVGRAQNGEPVIQTKVIPRIVAVDDEGCGQYRPRLEGLT